VCPDKSASHNKLLLHIFEIDTVMCFGKTVSSSWFVLKSVHLKLWQNW